jgi:Transposase, Mutator family
VQIPGLDGVPSRPRGEASRDGPGAGPGVADPKLHTGSVLPSLTTCTASRPASDLVKALGAGHRQLLVAGVADVRGPDAEVGAFRDRSLAGQTRPYVFLDATYCKARVERRVGSRAVVIANGVRAGGWREVLGFAVGDSEDSAFSDGVPALPGGPRPGVGCSWWSPTPTPGRSRPSRRWYWVPAPCWPRPTIARRTRRNRRRRSGPARSRKPAFRDADNGQYRRPSSRARVHAGQPKRPGRIEDGTTSTEEMTTAGTIRRAVPGQRENHATTVERRRRRTSSGTEPGRRWNAREPPHQHWRGALDLLFGVLSISSGIGRVRITVNRHPRVLRAGSVRFLIRAAPRTPGAEGERGYVGLAVAD